MSRKLLPINLATFTKPQIRDWINSFEVILTDCDGECTNLANFQQFTLYHASVIGLWKYSNIHIRWKLHLSDHSSRSSFCCVRLWICVTTGSGLKSWQTLIWYLWIFSGVLWLYNNVLKDSNKVINRLLEMNKKWVHRSQVITNLFNQLGESTEVTSCLGLWIIITMLIDWIYMRID